MSTDNKGKKKGEPSFMDKMNFSFTEGNDDNVLGDFDRGGDDWLLSINSRINWKKMGFTRATTVHMSPALQDLLTDLVKDSEHKAKGRPGLSAILLSLAMTELTRIVKTKEKHDVLMDEDWAYKLSVDLGIEK